MIHINNFHSIEKKLIKHFLIKTKLIVGKDTKKGSEKKHAYQNPSEKEKSKAKKQLQKDIKFLPKKKKGKRHKKIFLRNKRISKLSIEEIII